MSVKNKIFSRLNSLEVIVSPPPNLHEIIEMFDKNNSSAERLSKIILKDPKLTSRILRVANSSFYGCRQKVTSVNQAVMILGSNAVKCLVLSMSVYNQISAQISASEDEAVKLWQHILETATAAQSIAIGAKYEVPEEAYIAGLLHDFGLLFLQRYFPVDSARARRLITDGLPIIEAERRIFDTDHQEVGSLIASRWNLSPKLTETITGHHPSSAEIVARLPKLTQITVLADYLSPSNFETPDNLEQDGNKMEILKACCDSIGIGMDDIKAVYSVLPKQVLYHAEGLNLNMGDVVQYLSRVNSEFFDLYIELASTFKERQELSGKSSKEERLESNLESLHIALATLSHYINNSTMSISGQGEVLRLLYDKGDKEQAFSRIPAMTDAIKNSVRKISIILDELSNITRLKKIDYLKHSKAIDIEKNLKARLDKQATDML